MTMHPDRPDDNKAREPANRQRRRTLVRNIALYLDLPLALLALGFLLLFLGSLLVPTDEVWKRRIDVGMQGIWGVFLVEFLLRLVISPERGKFLRRNWFDVLVILLPAVRILRGVRVFRAVRILGPTLNPLASIRGLSLFRIGLVSRRGLRGAHRFMRESKALYLLALTAVVVLASAGLVLQFEQVSGNSTINSFGDALWWSAAVVTTVACDLNPVTAPGRVLAVALMVYGLFVFGYFVSQAVVFLHLGAKQREPGRASNASSSRTGSQ